MHKRCREIMDELILNGELEEITWFKFEPQLELKIRLKDMLEDEVDEKYLLSEKLVSYFNEHKKKHEEKGNGFGWKPTEGDSVASTITARVFKMGATDNYIKLKQ